MKRWRAEPLPAPPGLRRHGALAPLIHTGGAAGQARACPILDSRDESIEFRPSRCPRKCDLPGRWASPALCWRLLALPESCGAPKVTCSLSRDRMPGKTPVQARERVGLTRCSNRSDRLAIRRSPARTGWSDELFSRVPQCRRRLRAMSNFEGRNCRGRLHGHADAHADEAPNSARGKGPLLAARSGDRPAKESPAEAGLFWWPHAWVRSLPAHP
jgi:hypothetical protein